MPRPRTEDTSWKRHPNRSVERLALQWEALMDYYIARGDMLTVRKAETAWLDAYGDAAAMQATFDQFAPNRDTQTATLTT